MPAALGLSAERRPLCKAADSSPYVPRRGSCCDVQLLIVQHSLRSSSQRRIPSRAVSSGSPHIWKMAGWLLTNDRQSQAAILTGRSLISDHLSPRNLINCPKTWVADARLPGSRHLGHFTAAEHERVLSPRTSSGAFAAAAPRFMTRLRCANAARAAHSALRNGALRWPSQRMCTRQPSWRAARCWGRRDHAPSALSN